MSPDADHWVRTGQEGRGELSLVEVATVLLRRRRLITVTTASITAIVVAATLLWPRVYSAEASFVPEQSGTSLSALSNVAAQFGFALPGGDGAESPAFYADLLTTRPMLQRLVDRPYEIGDPDAVDSLDLAEYFGVAEGLAPVVRDRAVEKLRRQVDVGVDRETGIVTVRVETRIPTLSFRIVARMLDLLTEFNLERRQSRAAAERGFIGDRLEAASDELETSEDRLAEFLERNREFRSAPQLLFEHDRLQRVVAMRQQVYTSLMQAYEQARIEEVRNTPVVTIVEKPAVPARPDRRRLVLKAMLALVASTMVAVGLAILSESVRRHEGTRPGGFADLRELREEAARDLRRPWRLLLPSRHSDS